MTNWKIGGIFGSARRQREDTPQKQHRLASDVHASTSEEGLVLLHVPTGRVYRCNRTAARIWQGLANGLAPESISGHISRDFAIDEAVVRADTSRFVAQLEIHGFITK